MSIQTSKDHNSLPKNVADVVGRPQGLLIGDEERPAERDAEFDTFDPSSGSIINAVAHAQRADVDTAVRLSREALEGEWSLVAPSERGRMLYKLADLIEANLDLFAYMESLNNGSPLATTRDVLLPGVISHLRHFAGWADKLKGAIIDTGIPDMSVQVEREPVGAVAAIVPWNFPLTLAVWKVAPALAAGCTAILKPAEQTPLTALHLGRLALEAGIPPGVLQVLPGFGKTTGASLVSHPGVDKV